MATTPTTTSKNYFDPVTLDKISRLDLRAKMVVEGFITGQHKSPFHGLAVEFATHREYSPGDEIKHIDWKVWSKTDRYYIKEYEEETNLKCTFVVDCSKSMAYGGIAGQSDEGMSKFDYGATLAACLAHLLQGQQDMIGLVTFNEKIQKTLPPSSHPNHRKLLIHELELTEPSDKTDAGGVFKELAQKISKRGLVVLISDLFVDMKTLKESFRLLQSRKQDVVVMHIMHDDELNFPFTDNTLFRGLEIEAELHTEPRALRKSYLDQIDKFLHQVRRACASCGFDHVMVNTKDPLDMVLATYLNYRVKAGRRIERGGNR